MKRILLPTDFSPNADNAIRYALKLYANQTCTFYLLHTYTPATYFAGTNMPNNYSALQLEEIAANNANQGLDKTEGWIKSEFDNPEHSFVKHGAFNLLVNEVTDIVEAHNIHMIVMGTKGATGAREIFMGTQTVHTIRRAKCPVIAVPDNFHYEMPKEILFATDFEFDPDNRFLLNIREIAESHNSRINIMNVSDYEPLTPVQEARKSFLESYFAQAAHIFHTFAGMDITEAVADFQVKHKVNLLVMIHNKHTFFENILFKPVINQIAYHTNVPFLVIPSEKRIKT